MSQQAPGRKSSAPFLFLTGMLIGAGGLFLFISQWPHSPGSLAPNSVPVATADMSVPEIEIVTPTAEGKKRVDDLEDKMNEKLEGIPENSPERFAAYGSFAQQAEDAGMYDLAEVYYTKAFALGPGSYKTYFAKSVGDFQISWSYMYVNTGDLKKAVNIAEKVYAQEVKILGAESQQAIDAAATLAADLGFVKRYKEKQELSEKSIAVLEKLGKTKEGEYVTALRCLGESYQGMNKLPEAKHWYLKALAVSSAKPDLHSYTENLEQTLASFATIQASTESK